MKLITFIFCLFIFNLNIYAQKTQFRSKTIISGIISGVIIDADSGKALPSTTLKLIRTTDSTVENGAYTNNEGKFEIKNVPPGRYILRVSYIGFRDKDVRPIIVSEKKTTFNLGNIVLQPQTITGHTLEVNAERDLMQNDAEKKVINVDKNLNATSGSALDLMKTIPSVNVDIDGNVSLRGSQNVRILIDGKPSGMANSTVLDMLPASSIQNIELITNPSAKYDAEGSTGILNIVTKKDSQQGLNGSINLNAGTGKKFSSALNLNYKVGIFNIYGNYNLRIFNMNGYSILNQNNYRDSSVFKMFQNDDWRRNGAFHNIKIGTDISFDAHNFINLSVNYGFGTRGGYDLAKNIYIDSNTISFKSNKSYNTRSTDEKFPNQSLDLALGYKLTFDKKGHELTADVFYSPSVRDMNADYLQDYFSYNLNNLLKPKSDSTISQNSHSKNTNYNWSGQVDYKQPLNKLSKVEFGYKSSARHAEMDYNFFNIYSDIFVNDSSRSNDFVYDEKIQAAYLTYSDALGDLKYHFGFRSEYTNVISNQLTSNEKHDSSYWGFFPSGFLKYDFNSDQYVMLNYSRRVNRPDYRSLNPFINYEDPRNLSSGNPLLNPEYFNSAELSYSLYWDKFSLIPELYYKNTGKSINRILMLKDSITTISKPVNIASWSSIGSDISFKYEPYKWWKLDASLSYYRTIISGSYPLDSIKMVDLGSDRYSWFAKFNMYFNIISIIDLQISGYYNSPSATAQGRSYESYSFDAALKITLFDGNGAINLRSSDLFNTLIYKSEAAGYNFANYSERKRSSQVLFLGFSYKFNDYKKQNGERRGDENMRDTIDLGE
ncbi:MAG: TonB-dependent receptor [Candidatus Kapabacteria bacterium]|nr:TonB-dependent receptor [Candidatus Kapabacteria bacterium]